MADKLGHKNHTTVQGWWERDIIPSHRQRDVLDCAAAGGISVSAADLIPGKPSVETAIRAEAA